MLELTVAKPDEINYFGQLIHENRELLDLEEEKEKRKTPF